MWIYMSTPEESDVKGSSFARTATINVSDLTQYLLCPRLVYFHAKGYEQDTIVKGKGRGMIERIILKELAFNLDTLFGIEDEIGVREREEGENAKSIIEDIVDDIGWIYKEELNGVKRDLFEVVKRDIVCGIGTKEWLSKVRSGRLELEEAQGYEREYILVSEKLGMSGSVDKLIRSDEEVIPCVIKTGKCPEFSVWRSERVQLAAYAMLIEEEFETTVKRGFVEYIRTAEFRESRIRKKDRALALQILKRVKRIKRGAFPEKGVHAPCDTCSFIDRCETRKTLLSKLLGK
jgi:CRISPR-associated exonuclease Cas4